MKTTLIALLFLFSISLLQGGEPGEPLTWKDVVPDLPRIRIEPFLPRQDISICFSQTPPDDPVPDLRCLRIFPEQPTDAGGAVYFVAESGRSVPPRESALWRTLPNGKTQEVAHIDPRTVKPEVWDRANFQELYVDLVRGNAYVRMSTTCLALNHQECSYGTGYEVFKIAGLPALKRGKARSDHSQF